MSNHSVSDWIALLKTGDAEAAQRLWERFSEKLTRFAKKRIGGLPQRAYDENDVAQSVFVLLYRGAVSGRFDDISNRDDLWWLLIALTRHKTIDLARKESALKRGGGLVKAENFIRGDLGQAADFSLDQILGPDPTPELLAAMDEEHRRLLQILRDDRMRQIAVLRIEGYTVAEVAGKLAMTSRSVERKLQLIRAAWAAELGRAQAGT